MNSFLLQNKSFLLKLKRLFNSVTRIEISKYPSPELDRRIKLIQSNQIEVILDVGANIGQYGGEMRNLGFKGQIISFEPMQEAFTKLAKNAKNDPLWDVYHSSLGERDGVAVINISKNSVSSSLLNNLPQLTESAPEASFITQEEIKIAKLDTLFDSLQLNGKKIYLKIDTQGYEEKVLEGALNSLSKINGIQIEMAFIPSYEGALTYETIKQKLENFGFKLMAIENGFYDKKTGKQLEVDGIFYKP